MQPTRHALGALLLEQGTLRRSRSHLQGRFGLGQALLRVLSKPNNVWSLHGLHECLMYRGETVEVAHIKLQLDKAIAQAEVPIRASCYYRGAGMSSDVLISRDSLKLANRGLLKQ